MSTVEDSREPKDNDEMSFTPRYNELKDFKEKFRRRYF